MNAKTQALKKARAHSAIHGSGRKEAKEMTASENAKGMQMGIPKFLRRK